MNRRSLLLLAAAFSGCSKPPKPASNEPIKRYSMEGEVMRLDGDQVAVIKHKDIEGWMKAMTMDYPIRDKGQYANLKVGQHIQADVFVQGFDYWVDNIRQYQSDAPPAASKPATPKNVPNGR